MLAALLPALALPPAPARSATPPSLVGDPPVTKLRPDIEVYPQNNGVAQDAHAVIYVANAAGVLSFDGERWQLLRLPNGDRAEALAYDGNSRIYVGGYDLLGYLEEDDTGAPVFHDLTPLFRTLLRGERFAEVWQVLVAPQGVFFMSTNHLFYYRPDDGSVRLQRYAGRFGAAAVMGGQVVAQFRGEGLRAFHDGAWEPLHGSAGLRQLAFALVGLPDGGLLSVSNDSRWSEFHDGRVFEYAMPAGIPPPSRFNAACRLSDGTIALAGIDGSLWFYDPRAGTAHRTPVAGGSLAALSAARDGGLLVVSDLAVFHVDWPGDWTVVASRQGINGEVHRLRQWNGRWYALADNGVYAAGPAAPGGATPFQRLPWTDDDAWDLLVLDRRHALLAETYQLILINGERATPLPGRDLYPHLLVQSHFDGSRVYVGTDYGLAVLRRQGAGWTVWMDRGDTDQRVESIIELGADELLLGTLRDGVQRLRLSADGRRILDQHPLDAADGIAYGAIAHAALSQMPDGGVVASTGAGLFRWNGQKFMPLHQDGLDEDGTDRPVLHFERAPGGEQWAFGQDRIYRRQPGQAWRLERTSTLASGYVESIAFDGRATLFGCAGAILKHLPVAAEPAGEPAGVRLRSVILTDVEGRQTRLPLAPAVVPRFAHGNFALSFTVAIPDYEGSGLDRYQVQLLGHDKARPDWHTSTQFTYLRLEPGDYSFQARGRDSLGRISQAVGFGFTVLPPWYATRWAQALWLLLGLGALVLLTSTVSAWRTRRLSAMAGRLEQMVAERTRELEQANRQLHDMAHLDGLTAVANRRRLDDWLLQAWQQCGEHARPLAVMIIDVDEFKSYNDRMGHLAGDDLLRQIVQILSNCLRRAEDLVARYGGDEFVAVLPGADAEVAGGVAEAMRRRVELSGLGSTISVGVAARRPRPGEAVSTLLHEADAALYRSKQDGRNCVRIHDAG